MAEDNNEGTASSEAQAPAEDRVKNLQAEFSRKQGNLESKLDAINQQLQQMQLLNQPAAPAATSSRPDPILAPDEYERYMESKLEAKVSAKLETQQRQQAELGALVNAYPELTDQSSDLTREALRIYNSMSAAEKSNPLAYKSAIQSAALDLGILPKHKRQANKVANESDDLGAGSSNNSQSRQGKKQAKLDAATLAFAQALGRPTDDPEYIKKLEKHASRQSWGRYAGDKK